MMLRILWRRKFNSSDDDRLFVVKILRKMDHQQREDEHWDMKGKLSIIMYLTLFHHAEIIQSVVVENIILSRSAPNDDPSLLKYQDTPLLHCNDTFAFHVRKKIDIIHVIVFFSLLLFPFFLSRNSPSFRHWMSAG